MFTNEFPATLVGPDDWISGWQLHSTTPQSKTRRQQGGGGIMIWAGIIGNQIVSPFRGPMGLRCVPNRICRLFKKEFPTLVQELAFKKKII